MTLSSGAEVSWRLNDLLVAGQKARYLATKVADSSGQAGSEPAGEFSLWAPRVIQLIERGQSIAEVDGVPVSKEEIEGTDEAVERKSREDLEAQLKLAEQELEKSLAESYESGRVAGEKQVTERVQEHEAALLAIIAGMQKSQGNMSDFFEPLTRLALHLAEELVRGELTLSNTAIERLVKSAIDSIELSGEGPIVASLNATDIEKLDQEFKERYAHVEFVKDHHLAPGSVRVTMDATSIEDFVEDRLQELADQVLGLGHNRVRRAAERGRKSAPVEIDGGSVTDEDAKFETELDIVDVDADFDVDVDADVDAIGEGAEQASVDITAELDAAAKLNDGAHLEDPTSE
jgi:flagellar biosynthesis/type III secretory pathway protein FliH